MAEKKLLTRIIMNHGEWASYAGKVARDGEVIYVKVGTTQAKGNVSEPIWMQKIGDGKTEVKNLPWVVAPAADVYEWAKKANPDWNDFDFTTIPVIPGPSLGITVSVVGNGNAVTDASWDATTKTLTLTKGETFVTKSGFDGHTHSITATDDDVIIATGGELSVDVKHKKELGEGESYTTATTEATQAPKFGESATLNIPSLTVNEYGHITKAEDKTVTITIPGLDEVAESSHTHANGKGTIVSGNSAKAIDLNVALELIDRNIVLYDKSDSNKVAIASMAADEFIKDGMIQSVELVDDNGATGEDKVEGKFLKITWNTDADVDADDITYVDLTTLIDVYTAGKGITVTGKEIAHQAKPTTGTAETATAGSGRTYVTEVLVDDLGHIAGVKTATETDQDLTHNHDDVYKKLQEAVVDPTANGKTLAFIDSISQNENGEITATKKNVNLDDYALKSELPTDFGVTEITSNDTTPGDDSNVSGLKVTPVGGTGVVNIEIDDTIVFILDGGDASDLD